MSDIEITLKLLSFSMKNENHWKSYNAHHDTKFLQYCSLTEPRNMKIMIYII